MDLQDNYPDEHFPCVIDAPHSGSGPSSPAVRYNPSLINADSDWEAILSWLSRCRNPNTATSYFKEADRFYRWLRLNGRSLATLKHEDFLSYEAFIVSPPADWIGKKLPRTDPGWRPFYGPLSKASVRQAMVILDGMMQWLVQAGYIAANPMILQQVSRGGRKRLERFLTQSELSACLSLLDAQELKVARERWLFSVLAMAGLRISEVCTLRMSDFHVSRRDPGQWWLSVLGKGSKVRLVPVSDQLLDELQRFRRRLAREFGLRPALPPANETLPALPSLRDPEVFVTRSSLHTAVKSMCERLSATLLQNNPDLSTLVSSVSAHWLRHSYGTMLADNEVDLRVIMDNMGHSSIQSTQIYLHTQDRSRHEAVKEIEIKS